MGFGIKKIPNQAKSYYSELISESSYSIERFRNKLYQKWLLNRLIKQTINDPFNNESNDYEQIKEQIDKGAINTIRQFDKIITSQRFKVLLDKKYLLSVSPPSINLDWLIKSNLADLNYNL